MLIPISGETTRRWAAWEERALKRLLRTTAAAGSAPWFEIYARAEAAREVTSPDGSSPGLAPAA